MMRVILQQRCKKFGSDLSFLLIFLLLVTSPAVNAESTPDEQKLARLQKKIAQLQSELESDNQQKDQAVHQLKIAEQAIASSAENLRHLNRQLKASEKALQQLGEEQNDLHNQLQANRHFLIKQIQASYAIGKQEYIKLLLNQQDPSEVARMVVYYRYFNESRARRLEEIDSSLSRLSELSEDIEKKKADLLQIQAQAVEDQKSLDNNRRQRQQLVAQLTNKLKQKDSALKALLRDEQHLKRLLDQIENELKDVEADLAPPKDFNLLKGQLPWPTDGRLTALFDSVRNITGNLKWKGIVIETQPGADIRAVAYGRVVFADWLRGFGMLLIIDHGKGYMSLYGHNEQLHKKLGDWVQAGELIATTGNTGGQETTSLYFEIRHNGTPLNPRKWCKSLPHRS